MSAKSQPIVLHSPLWGDERVWCKFARSNDIRSAVACPNLKDGPSTGSGHGYCALNGAEAKSPCVFDEVPDATIWREIRDSLAEYRRKGWPE